MILLWFIIGMALIFGIARYNESNKLFWVLLLSYMIGFAGTKMVLDVHNGNNESNENLVQVYSTQMLDISTAILPSQFEMFIAPEKVTASNSVSQSYTPIMHKNEITLRKVFGKVRDQPLLTLIKPPELCLQKDFLILHDSG
jgi:hypothetical protein